MEVWRGVEGVGASVEKNVGQELEQLLRGYCLVNVIIIIVLLKPQEDWYQVSCEEGKNNLLGLYFTAFIQTSQPCGRLILPLRLRTLTMLMRGQGPFSDWVRTPHWLLP